MLKLRKYLGLYANIRTEKIYPAFIDASSLKAEVLSGTDFIVLRELTGGIYFGEPRGYDKTRGWNTMSYMRDEVDRIVHMAFEMAKQRGGKLTSVDKANVLEATVLWREIVEEVAQDYPDVELSHMYVDNAAMQLVRAPKQNSAYCQYVTRGLVSTMGFWIRYLIRFSVPSRLENRRVWVLVS